MGFANFTTREDHIAKLAQGTHAFYFVGRVIYTDAFGELRFTRFCFTYEPSLKENLGFCSVYNEAT